MFNIAAKLSGVEPGIYTELSNEAYHSGPGISKSNLDAIHRSPAHFLASFDIHEEPTKALSMGTAVHTAVLEPERFKVDFVIPPSFNRRTKDGKTAAEEWERENCGKTPISVEDMAIVTAMRESVMNNPIAAKLVEMTQHETSVFAKFDDVLCKCRPDGWQKDKGILIDLKTTEDASPEGFAKACARYRYYVQDTFYRTVVSSLLNTDADKLSFVFVAVEKKPPFAVALYSLDDLAKLQGWVEIREDLRNFREAVESHQWRGYSPKIETLSLPRWAVASD